MEPGSLDSAEIEPYLERRRLIRGDQFPYKLNCDPSLLPADSHVTTINNRIP